MEWIPALRRYVSRVALGDAARAQAEVLSWSYAPALPDNVLHRHTYFEVCTVGAWGAGTFTLNGREHVIAAGDTFFARPGELHRIQNTSLQPMELFWVAFALSPTGAAQAEDSPSELFARSPIAVRAGDAGTLAIWHALRAAPTAARPDVMRSLAQSLLLSIFHAGNPNAAPTDNLLENPEDEHAVARLAVRYIHDNLGRRLPVEEVAAHVHTSPRHLTRLLRVFTGASPREYIEIARIQRARHLLQHERAGVKQAARATGYLSVQHFTRAFSRRVGISPAAFRTSLESVAEAIVEDGDLL